MFIAKEKDIRGQELSAMIKYIHTYVKTQPDPQPAFLSRDRNLDSLPVSSVPPLQSVLKKKELRFFVRDVSVRAFRVHVLKDHVLFR